MPILPSILNLSALLFLVRGYHTYWTTGRQNDTEGWGKLAVLVLTGFSGAMIALDTILQVRLVGSWSDFWLLNGLEALPLALIGLVYGYRSRGRTLVIPDDMRGHVAIVYEVPDAPRLYRFRLRLRYHIEIPADGIRYTSSRAHPYRPVRKIRGRSGQAYPLLRPSGELQIVSLGLHLIRCPGFNVYAEVYRVASKDAPAPGGGLPVELEARILVGCENQPTDNPSTDSL